MVSLSRIKILLAVGLLVSSHNSAFAVRTTNNIPCTWDAFTNALGGGVFGGIYWANCPDNHAIQFTNNGSITNIYMMAITNTVEIIGRGWRNGVTTVFVDEAVANKAWYFEPVDRTAPYGISHMTFISGSVDLSAQRQGGAAFLLCQNDNPYGRINDNHFNFVDGRYVDMIATSTNIMAGLFQNNWVNIKVGYQGPFFRTPNSPNIGNFLLSLPYRWGTSNVWCFQSNVITYFNGTAINHAADGNAGMGYTVRYNIGTNIAFETHEFGGAGIREHAFIEGYGNRFYTTNQVVASASSPYWIRSGTGIFFDNVTGGAWPSLVTALIQRLTDGYQFFEQATGTNGYDINTNNLTNYRGTHTGSDFVNVLTDSTANWTPGELAGRHVLNENTSKYGYIVTNTATTITLLAPTHTNNWPYWTNGHVYSITGKVVKVLGQPGVKWGTRLTADTVTKPTPITWPHDGNLPITIWNNSGSVGNTYSMGSYLQIVAGENITNVADRASATWLDGGNYPGPLTDDHPLDQKDLDLVYGDPPPPGDSSSLPKTKTNGKAGGTRPMVRTSGKVSF